MPGSFTSSRKQVVAAIRRDAAMIVNRHALGVLNESNRNVPQVGFSLGYATGALKASGHVLLAGSEGRRRNKDAYDLALSDAMHAREENADMSLTPGLVEPLTRSDFLPAIQLQETPAVARAAVYYPINYAMALEMGFTLNGTMHPQAFFLERAMSEREALFYADVQKMLDGLTRISAPPFKVPLTAAQKELRQRIGAQRAIDAQFRRENGDLGKYGPYESFGEMLDASGETRGRGKGESFGEAAERVRNAAMAAWEGRGGFDKGRRG